MSINNAQVSTLPGLDLKMLSPVIGLLMAIIWFINGESLAQNNKTILLQ